MKIVVTGTRGIPNIQGGVETHAQNLYPRAVKLGRQVTVITRSCYVNDTSINNYKGVKLKHIYAPRKKSFEAIIHTFLACLFAYKQKPDYLHIHAIGPMLLTPFAKILGLKVVVTHHGPDYNRLKWGKIAKKILKFGEKMGMTYADKIIVISKEIEQIAHEQYHRFDSKLIPNGVHILEKPKDISHIQNLKLEPNNYILAIGRFVEEKGYEDLIKAYKKIDQTIPLVIVGDAHHETKWSKSFKEYAIQKNVLLTGFLSGKKQLEVLSNARLFVLPSYHEGLSITLLEAMSFNLDILVSDISSNVEVNLEKEDYFKVGDIEDLSIQIEKKLQNPQKRNFEKSLHEKYNWDQITKDYLEYLEN